MADLKIDSIGSGAGQIARMAEFSTATPGGASQAQFEAALDKQMQTQERQMESLSPELSRTPDTRAVGNTFSEMLRTSVDSVNRQQVQADTAIKELLAGRNKNIHETMLAIEKADASLKLMMQVRNKVLDAYKEIMRMQV